MKTTPSRKEYERKRPQIMKEIKDMTTKTTGQSKPYHIGATEYDSVYGYYHAEVLGENSCCVAEVHGETEIEALANAAFIVRACNSHDALVEALKLAMRIIADCYPAGHEKIKEIEAAINSTTKGN